MLALEGFRIVDMTLYQHGSSATTYLADMGAEVIKIEDTLRGDPGRGLKQSLNMVMQGPNTRGINLYFEAHNRNKKGIALNLKNELAREALYKLVAKSDAFVSNYRPLALDRLKLDYQTLTQYNPKLVYAIGTGYGSHGPEKDKPAVDALIQVRSGLTQLVTPAGWIPMLSSRGAADQFGALMLAFGIVTALLVRQKEGIGQEVHSSLLRSAISIQGHYIQSGLLTGNNPAAVPRDRVLDALHNVYKGKDGRWFMLSDLRSAESWPDFCHVLGIEHLMQDPDFATFELRLKNGKRLISIFDDIFATRPAKEWVKILQDKEIWCELVCTYDEVIKDPQLLANEYITQVDHAVAGRIWTQGVPVELSKTPGKVRGGAPVHGQHTEEVLIDIAGYTWDELAKLKQAGAII